MSETLLKGKILKIWRFLRSLHADVFTAIPAIGITALASWDRFDPGYEIIPSKLTFLGIIALTMFASFVACYAKRGGRINHAEIARLKEENANLQLVKDPKACSSGS